MKRETCYRLDGPFAAPAFLLRLDEARWVVITWEPRRGRFDIRRQKMIVGTDLAVVGRAAVAALRAMRRKAAPGG